MVRFTTAYLPRVGKAATLARPCVAVRASSEYRAGFSSYRRQSGAMTRKLAVISGKYGGFRAMVPMFRYFDADPSWEMVVYLCDQHLWASRGTTAWEARTKVKEVCTLATKVSKRLERDRLLSLHTSFEKLLYIWEKQRPDLVIVYGDRLDALYGAMLAQELNIPVAHLQAGDKTGGTDDARRWAISALATYLFCSSDNAHARCMNHWQLHQKVSVVGDHHIDAVKEIGELDRMRQDWTAVDQMPLKPYYVVHMHPDTLASERENRRVCTELWAQFEDEPCAVLPPCNDRMWEVVDLCTPTTPNIVRFKHLPLEQYVPLLQNSKGLVGNSSATFIDAPALGVPTFVFGDRQLGRDKVEGDGKAGLRTYEYLNEVIK